MYHKPELEGSRTPTDWGHGLALTLDGICVGVKEGSSSSMRIRAVGPVVPVVPTGSRSGAMLDELWMELHLFSPSVGGSLRISDVTLTTGSENPTPPSHFQITTITENYSRQFHFDHGKTLVADESIEPLSVRAGRHYIVRLRFGTNNASQGTKRLAIGGLQSGTINIDPMHIRLTRTIEKSFRYPGSRFSDPPPFAEESDSLCAQLFKRGA